MDKHFYIVGAPKAGTTSIYNYLQQHKNVFLPELKELHFFSYPEVADTYYKVPIIHTLEDYEHYFKQVTKSQISGDVSPSYLYNQKAAQRIHDYDPNAKIIIILRDPVARAISHYLMDVRIGYQNKSLMEILNNPKNNQLFYKEYVEVGMYADQVSTYLNTFPKKNILIIDFQTLKNDSQKILKTICRHLDIDDSIAFDLSKEYNTFAMPKNKRLIYFLKQNIITRTLIKLFPNSLIQKIKPLFYKKTQKPSMEQEQMALIELFRDDITTLQGMVDFDVMKWIKKYEY